MKNSAIEWCDHTFNCWEGCTKVSPGCANCYAETRNQRYHSGKNWGPGAQRMIRSDAYWREPLKWNAEAAKTGKRPRVFCASLSDWLDDEGPVDQLARLMALIHDTQNLDWLLLSKRTESWRERVTRALATIEGIEFKNADEWDTNCTTDVGQWLCDWLSTGVFCTPPSNVWIGATAENQEMADKRVPELLRIPAVVRFISYEPALGPVDMFHSGGDPYPKQMPRGEVMPPGGISWVICGCESGPGARPMNLDWARSLRDQCAEAGVPFFFKQVGGVHKKLTGRLLDGREHNEFPVIGGAA